MQEWLSKSGNKSVFSYKVIVSASDEIIRETFTEISNTSNLFYSMIFFRLLLITDQRTVSQINAKYVGT